MSVFQWPPQYAELSQVLFDCLLRVSSAVDDIQLSSCMHTCRRSALPVPCCIAQYDVPIRSFDAPHTALRGCVDSHQSSTTTVAAHHAQDVSLHPHCTAECPMYPSLNRLTDRTPTTECDRLIQCAFNQHKEIVRRFMYCHSAALDSRAQIVELLIQREAAQRHKQAFHLYVSQLQ